MAETLLFRPPAAPPPVPEGWRTGPPDFVGVGTIRSGTTWWHYLIDCHPDVASPSGRPKEVHFFDQFRARRSGPEPDAYHAYFPRPVGARCGEWTPRYMFDEWTPPLLARSAPDARLLVLLRDPVERMSSALTYIRDLGGPLDAEMVNREFVRSLYWSQLSRLNRCFPRDRILVLQYERCVADLPGELTRTFTFLGLDPAGLRLTAHHGRPRNATASTKVPVDRDVPASTLATFRDELRRLAVDYPEVDQSLWPSAGL